MSSRWLRHKRSPVDAIESAGEVDDRFGEKPAKQLDLFLLPRPTGMEVLSQRLVFDVVPADPHTEAQSAAREKIDIGCLASDKCSGALRQDENAGGEVDPLGDAGEVGEHHERVVEWVVFGIRPRQWRISIGMHGAQNVVVGKEVVEAQVLDSSAECPERPRDRLGALSGGTRRQCP